MGQFYKNQPIQLLFFNPVSQFAGNGFWAEVETSQSGQNSEKSSEQASFDEINLFSHFLETLGHGRGRGRGVFFGSTAQTLDRRTPIFQYVVQYATTVLRCKNFAKKTKRYEVDENASLRPTAQAVGRRTLKFGYVVEHTTTVLRPKNFEKRANRYEVINITSLPLLTFQNN